MLKSASGEIEVNENGKFRREQSDSQIHNYHTGPKYRLTVSWI